MIRQSLPIAAAAAVLLALYPAPGRAQSRTDDLGEQINEKVNQQLEKMKDKLDKLDAKKLKLDDLDFDFDFDLNLDLKGLMAQNPPKPPNPPVSPRPPRVEVFRGGDNNQDRLYQNGTRALDGQRWDQAIEYCARVETLGGSRADGALYWTAWAQSKQGNSAAALESLSRLRQSYPSSRWVTEARALEVEIRQAAGQSVRPENVPDDELKLMALNSLVKADEQRVIPMLDKIVKGTGSPRLKERALFVLAQNGSPQARQAVTNIAKGDGNPDLQAKAVMYLGAFGDNDSRQALSEIYKSSTNIDVKRNILRAFMATGDRDRLLELAKSEQNADLRAEAVQQLAGMGAQDQVWQLYQNDMSTEVRKKIIQAMVAMHNEPRLVSLLKTENDPDLRRSIVQTLGSIPSPASTDALKATYISDKDDGVRRAVVDALAQQRNSAALIELSRKETDATMKKRILERLTTLKSPEATDYFLELLGTAP